MQFVNNTSNSEDLAIMMAQGSFQFISQFILISRPSQLFIITPYLNAKYLSNAAATY